MFNPAGCFCCEPPEDPCGEMNCDWSSTSMSDDDIFTEDAYDNPVSGSTPDGTYTIANEQYEDTGNDAPCRLITIETVEAPHKPDTVYAICWIEGAKWTPSESAPLRTIWYCFESKRHFDSDAGLIDGVRFFVKQSGRIYRNTSAAMSVGVNWTRHSGGVSGPGNSGFVSINGSGRPNFSGGEEVQIGIGLQLAVGKDEEPFDAVMFDNVCISLDIYACVPASCLWSKEYLFTVDGVTAPVQFGDVNGSFVLQWSSLTPSSQRCLWIGPEMESGFRWTMNSFAGNVLIGLQPGSMFYGTACPEAGSLTFNKFPLHPSGFTLPATATLEVL